MQQLRFIPLLNGYSPTFDEDVLRSALGDLPQIQRLNTRLPYLVKVDFELNGVEHDELMAFWQAHKAHVFQVQMTIEDSELRWYDCLFEGAPTITPVGGKTDWKSEDINLGTCDTHRHHYKSSWQLIALQRYRLEEDLAILAAFEATSKDPFAKYDYVESIDNA